ncbi:hypothetical protein LAL4801_04428 [Roseibium aggregatum]|uniref:Uncharacterized protein n=1 Tax=Roseibium aggregatum TaxID=187304 RepID=A0A0M6Y8V9_9HYPH|nr:hypothetical protein LAL4801_04428 [Roseibium aggregatum]
MPDGIFEEMSYTAARKRENPAGAGFSDILNAMKLT